MVLSQACHGIYGLYARLATRCIPHIIRQRVDESSVNIQTSPHVTRHTAVQFVMTNDCFIDGKKR